MQIDFHHGVTYVVARLAGFEHQDAQVIAYSAQYVDDATNAGIIRFNNGTEFNHVSSAHKFLDYRNFRELAHHQVWMPFHFLPGNGGLPADQSPIGSFIDKLICRPNSYIAQDMVAACISNSLFSTHPTHPQSHSLHRLGITMHVYADTWAHQGFAGISHPVNEAKILVDAQGKIDQKSTERVKRYFNKNFVNRFAHFFISEVFPLGHGAVLSNPDRPYLKWGYTNGLNQRIMRDNPTDFLEAADQMCRWMQRYRIGDPAACCPGLPQADKQLIAKLLQTTTKRSSRSRHKIWLRAIAEGQFSFGKTQVTYKAKGKGSWKHQALGTEAVVDTGDEIFPFQATFLDSHWKRFHDALEEHRTYVVHKLLPKYGIRMGSQIEQPSIH
ncbi:hypothetical protein C1752_02000 [Acaryochloris thomasi RCC1774]|uniref:Uncharacterized protein n=1 Tax=Acaryochloris thomasi RCC1774 TaxID=1764569 RepID=A0A2W1JUN7_9CYAN|nr:DUF6765 family protein [Acaryochloris thomasi]PZD73484.1 hypothetical protein C1752_02000 [Acaryochloris thomasi RCC1774]